MKIGFDAKRVFHNDTGLGNYSRTLLRQLQSSYPEHEYHLYSPSYKSQAYSEYFENEDAFIVHQYDGVLHPYWRAKGIVSDLKKDGIVLFHGLSTALPLGLLKSGIKSIVTVHDLIPEERKEDYSAIQRGFYNRKARQACEDADHIIAISEKVKQDILKYYQVEENSITVMYQDIDPSLRETPSHQDVTATMRSLRTSDPFVLFVGTGGKRKGVDWICDFAEKYLAAESISLVIISRDTAPAALPSNVHWLKGTGDKQLLHLYHRAKALIYPSYSEGYGLPIHEALACGCPALTLNMGPYNEQVKEGLIHLGSLDDMPAWMDALKSASRFSPIHKPNSGVKDLESIYLKLVS